MSDTIYFDSNQLPEKARIRLETRSDERKDHVQVVRDAIAPAPVATKSCRYCHKTIPLTNKGFVCVVCCVIGQ